MKRRASMESISQGILGRIAGEMSSSKCVVPFSSILDWCSEHAEAGAQAWSKVAITPCYVLLGSTGDLATSFRLSRHFPYNIR